MKKLLQEPLLHFLLLGALIFGIFSVLSRGRSDDPGKIVVTQGHISSLVTGFTRTWQRQPTKDELDGLIRDHIREQMAVREAIALGLDKDDLVIQRRLRQKLEFITDSVVDLAEPSDEQLQKYLDEHPEAFKSDEIYTFTQVYLDPKRREQTLERDVTQILTQLNQAGAAADVSNVGDAILIDQVFEAVPAPEISKQFGEKFAARLAELPAGQWQGPIESGYGMHLVLVTDRKAGRLPKLSEIREAVFREWANAQRTEAREKFYVDLLKRYTVTIEEPKPDAAAGDKR